MPIHIESMLECYRAKLILLLSIYFKKIALQILLANRISF